MADKDVDEEEQQIHRSDAAFIGYNAWVREDLNITVAYDFVYKATCTSDEDGNDRGVFVNEEITPNKLLVSVPFDSLLTVDSIAASSSPLKKGLDTTLDEKIEEDALREEDLLTILLIYHTHVLGDASPWHRHLVAAVRGEGTIHNILTFDADQVKELKGTMLYHLTIQLFAQVQSDYAILRRTVLNDLETQLNVERETFSYTRYKWALSVIWSRFFSIKRKERVLKAMAPVFDMFNHDPDAMMHHGFNEEKDAFELVSAQSWPAGSQVYINYGALPNQKLLMLYGFVLEDNNPFESVSIWAPMSKEAKNFTIKNKLLLDHNIKHSTTPFEITTTELCPALMTCLRVQRMIDSEFPKAHVAFQGEILSERNEKEVLEALRYALQLMIDEFETTVEQDEMILRNSSTLCLDSHQRMAIIVRAGDKRILQANIDMIKERLDDLALKRGEFAESRQKIMKTKSPPPSS